MRTRARRFTPIFLLDVWRADASPSGHRRNIEIPIIKSSARITAQLNYLCPQFFPAPGFWSLQHLKHTVSDFRASSEVCCEIVLLQTLTRITEFGKF